MEKTDVYIPNILDYQTSEETQDTFLAWLLQWSEKKYKKINEKLHSCACDMLELFIDEKIDVTSMEVYKKYEDIDLWFIINNNTILIIEDKTFNSVQDNGLEEYKRFAENWCNDFLSSYKLKCVYCKTDDYTYSESDYVKKSGYKAINRKDILRVLKKHYESANNDFIKDYYLYFSKIEHIENEVFEKRFDEIKQCKDDLLIHMKGFSSYFSNKLKADWKFVDKPNNPYIAMFWNWKPWEYGEYFLEFENFSLKLKVYIDLSLRTNLSPSDIRKLAWDKVINIIEHKGYKISKPDKLRGSTTTTIGCLDESMWLYKDNDGNIDKEETLKKLKSLDTLLSEIVSK